MGIILKVLRFYDTDTLRGRHRILKTIGMLLAALMVAGGSHGYANGGANEVLEGALYWPLFGVAGTTVAVLAIAVVIVIFLVITIVAVEFVDWAKGADL